MALMFNTYGTEIEYDIMFLNIPAMRTNLLIILLFISFFRLSAQDISTSANGLKSEKQLKKERKDAEKNLQYTAIGSFLDSMRFVLEAEYLSNNTGVRSIVDPYINYILVDSLEGAIQTGSNYGLGRNGVGGATAKGSIYKWKITKNDKKKSYYIKMDLSTDLGSYTIFMDVYSDGKASAQISGISSGSLTFDGYLVPLKKSRVFRARSGY
jgi:hypothetical protein